MTPVHDVFLACIAAAFIVWGVGHFDGRLAAALAIVAGLVMLGVALFGKV